MPRKPHDMVRNIDDIAMRNQRVEAEKAREMSWTRRMVITIGTYVIVFLYLRFIGIDQAHLHALVPPFAFLTSTLSFPILKRIWIQYIYKVHS